jgi:MarR family transcriptional regulator for hemolysin
VDDLPETISSLVHEVARLMRGRFEQGARGVGLTRSQWLAIACLSKNEGIHQAGLAELLDIEPITLVRILDKLADRGLIERRQHPTDRRTWLLYVKEAAHPLLAAMQPLAEATRAEALGGVAQADRESFARTLTQMKSNLMAVGRAPVAEKEAHYG